LTESHEGGCLCGAVRFRVTGRPVRTSACHCASCQRRTGSAFGLGAYFNKQDVELRGELKIYEFRSDETHRWLRLQFCPSCGTTVTWTLEAQPGMRAIGVGTFDDPKWLRVERFGWMRSAHPWIAVPEGVEVFERGSLPPAKTA
jgi:hypothetical protein